MSDAGSLALRLLADPAFRAAFAQDAAAACRAYGLDRLADGFDGERPIARLNGRESRSGLSALLMGLAAHGAEALHGSGHAPAGLGTGHLQAIAQASGHGYPGDDAPPARIAAWMAAEARRHHLPGELPVMAALVESNLKNLPDGDAASVGYFQMQTTVWLQGYPGYPDHPELQMKWFIDRALEEKAKQPELAADERRWGEWVANIEQCRSDLRWKYGDRLGDARALLAGAGDPPMPRHDAHAAVYAPQTGAHAAVGSHDAAADRMKAEADRIERAHVTYLLGGGHEGREPYGSPIVPLDCSGTVSRVLGLAPRVARDFETYGAAGPGRRITIYAADDHVLMEIDGRLFGTSRTNPGGGPGWIARSQLPPGYLDRFTVRHPVGL